MTTKTKHKTEAGGKGREGQEGQGRGREKGGDEAGRDER